MSALARTTEINCDTRAANEDCINGGSRTRTKYAYDANGNVTSRNGSIVGWTSYNYPDGVTTATESATFDYGPDRQRWRMIYTGPSANETTFYATPKFEKVYAGGGGEYRSYIYAGNRPVVIVMRNTASQIKVRSLLVDHQGSISSIVTDSTGASLVGESFTAYGNRREASTWSGTPTSAELTTMSGVTRQGYTFQTVLGSMGLNHMNGRIEDSVTGRFLSPDPRGIIQGNTQSWNRYSYVLNNPVTLTDPTGHNPFKRCSGDFCPTQHPGRKQYYDVGSLGPTSNNTSGVADGMQGWTGSDSGGDIGSVGYNGDNGGTGIGGATAVAYAAASTPNTPGGSADDDPELQPIVVTATRIGDDGSPQPSAQVIGQGLPTNGQLTQRQIDTAVEASAEQELALENQAAARAAGQTEQANKYGTDVQLAIDKYIDANTPGSSAPITPPAPQLLPPNPIDIPDPKPVAFPP